MRDVTLIMMVGLPRSGKTTRAREISAHFNAPIVNPDSIRLVTHGQRFYAPAEPQVWAAAQTMVRALFVSGHDVVIIDACNTSKKRRDNWDLDLSYHGIKLCRAAAVITTEALQCVARAEKQGDHKIIPVIKRMALNGDALAADEEIVIFEDTYGS